MTPLKQMLVLRMTRQRALELGLLVCTCGHPENNHFRHGGMSCAHCDCTGLKEVGRKGVDVKKSQAKRAR